MGDVTQMPPRSPLDRPPEGEKKRGTLAEFEWILAESGVTVQFDVVRKRQIVEVPGAVTTAENSAETMRAYIVDLCKRHGYPVGQIDGYLVAVADRHAVNPVMDWIDSIPWDGESRYGDLLDTLGFYGPDGREHGCMLLRRWMISAVAAVSDPVTTRAKGVLVLQGPQDCGKTQWLERLGAEWFLEGHILDPHDKDTMISAAEHWIVELGEIDATFRRADIAAIKSYLGKREDKVRLAYAHRNSRFPRRTVYCGSVNPRIFLHDETGNSRFWSVPVTDADFTHAIDVQQLWAEVMSWYRAGERHWLDRDEQEILTRRNRDHTAPDVIRELLEAAINDGAHESTWLDTTPSDYLRRCGFSTTKSAATVIGMLFRERGYSVVGTTSNKAAIYRVPPPMDPR